jgi:mutator protein MutT
MLIVVAAIIEFQGKLLVCQRRKGSNFELKWEFPGGKKKPGETLAQALSRELSEELGIEAVIGPEIYRTRHRYAELSEPIELVFFAATAHPDRIENRVFERIEWREPAQLRDLDFLPADRDLVEKLAAGEFRQPR